MNNKKEKKRPDFHHLIYLIVTKESKRCVLIRKSERIDELNFFQEQ